MAWERPRSARLPGNWQTIRRRILTRDPTCRACGSSPSVEVDHIIAGDDHDDANLQGLCSPCHRAKTNREAHAARAQRPRRQRPAGKHPGLR